MANEFSKEERVAFDEMLLGFEDALVLSRNVTLNPMLNDTDAERALDTLWRPMPYIAQSFDGTDITALLGDNTQLSVPTTIGYQKTSPWFLTAKQLRDASQANRLRMAAAQKLASDINVAVQNVACNEGTLVVTRSAAATGFDDVAKCEQVMNEQGIQHNNRHLALSTADYNGMAGNLAGRQNLVAAKTITAYEKAEVGQVASFRTWKLDYANRIAVAGGGGGITISTLASGVNVYVPRATSVASTGQRSNVDNRYQTVTVSSTTSVAAGDCFTIATVQSVHHITKGRTGNLKTFRVISVDSSTTMTISPPLITGQGGTDAELMYQNCSVVTPASNSAIVFLNTDAANINPFWQYDAIELTPSKDGPIDTDAGAAIMRGSTDQGIELLWIKQFDALTKRTIYRADISFGVTMLQPEMAGIILFGQDNNVPA